MLILVMCDQGQKHLDMSIGPQNFANEMQETGGTTYEDNWSFDQCLASIVSRTQLLSKLLPNQYVVFLVRIIAS